MVCVWPTCDKGYTVFFRLHIPIREDWFCLRIYYPFKVVLIFKAISKLIHRVVGFITVYMHICHYLLLFIIHPPPFTCSLSTSGWSWPPLPSSPLLRIHVTSILLPALSPSTALPASFPPKVLLLISFEEQWNLSSEHETKCDNFLSESDLVCFTRSSVPPLSAVESFPLFPLFFTKSRCTCVLHFLHPFVCWWTSRMAPFLSYCD